tara:strand:+ start:106 stop:372 length:267 start_codon:yes stop_codon:yes gene_type:complete
MTLTFNIGGIFNESSNDALVDELRKRTSSEAILDFENKFNSKNDKNLHIHICRFLKHRQISRSLAAKWLIVMINNKESQINIMKDSFN